MLQVVLAQVLQQGHGCSLIHATHDVASGNTSCCGVWTIVVAVVAVIHGTSVDSQSTTSKREGAVTERKGNWVFTPSQTREVLQHSLSADKSTMSWEHGPDTCKRIIIQYPLFCKLNVFLDYNLFYIYKYHLVAKGLHRGGWGFWLPIKSVSNTLSCCFVCAFIIGQYHSGDNMSSKYGDAGATFIFESKKRHGIWPLKMDTLTVSAFDAFIHVHDESKLYLSHRFEQWRYCFTQCRCEQELFVYRFLQ